MDSLALVERALAAFSDYVWLSVLWLLLGGGVFFFLYSRLVPYQYMRHAYHILRGDYDDPDEAGDISHFQALASALSATLGMGNIAGVAVAIHVGGPGAIFWMWVTALVGIATKFFTCSLAIMYRGRDDDGMVQGGPMYVVTEGLSRRWHFLAYFFCIAAVLGTLPVFQANQLTQVVRDVIAVPNGWTGAEEHFRFDLLFGAAIALVVGVVIFGGIRRVGATAARVVPSMVVLYVVATLYIVAVHVTEIPSYLLLIVRDAFSGEAAAGGFLAVLVIGVRRGAFSNEAGIGTESMAHGAAQTNEPIREGLVAMLGPVVDTLVVCTCTALAILMTGVWEGSEASGVTLTAEAFGAAMGGFGPYLLAAIVVFYSVSTMFTFWYYGAKCLGFLIGTRRQHLYRYLYTGLIVGGSVVSIDAAVDLITGMYGLMAIPTVVSTLLLAPRVMEAARDYFARHP